MHRRQSQHGFSPVCCPACHRLDTLYVQTDACPILRPLLAHPPRKTRRSLAASASLGYLYMVGGPCSA